MSDPEKKQQQPEAFVVTTASGGEFVGSSNTAVYREATECVVCGDALPPQEGFYRVSGIDTCDRCRGVQYDLARAEDAVAYHQRVAKLFRKKLKRLAVSREETP